MNRKEENSISENSIDSLMEIKIFKKESSINNTSNINSIENNNNSSSNNITNTQNNIESSNFIITDINQKQKRHRRGKYIFEKRDYKCSECLRTYLSSSALKNHKRMKHNKDNEKYKKGRGRPKKEFYEKEHILNMNQKYEKFLVQNEKNKEYNITIKDFKNIFDELYNNYKNELFGSLNNNLIEKNNFYLLLKENWEKELINNLELKSYSSMINCTPPLLLVNKPPIDVILFIYLKYCKKKFNKEYFLFIIKFIIIFRQYINIEKKRSINVKYIHDNKKEYTQIYDASVIPDFFNDFLVDFMENRNYFNLNKNNIIILIEYFCFWLYKEGYTDSHLSKMD